MKKCLHDSQSAQRIRLNKRARRMRSANLKQGEKPRFLAITVIAPEMLSLVRIEDRHLLLSMLNKIRAHTLRSSLRDEVAAVRIDFSKTKRAIVDGAILLLAELCRLKEEFSRNIRLSCIPPTNHKVSQVFSQIGLSRIVGCAATRPRDRDVVHWRTAQGHDVSGEKCDEILGPYHGVITDSLSSSIYRGMTEAMTNVIHHAYIAQRDDGLTSIRDEHKRWWMFSQEKDHALEVVICDLGVGIPRSLPHTNPGLFKSLIARLAGDPLGDSQAIIEAIEYGRSRVGQENRGKGLSDIVDATLRSGGGSVSILSNKGYCNWRSGNPPFHYNYSESILGTIISWKIPLTDNS